MCIRDRLRDLIQKSQLLYSKAFPSAKWREQKKEWRFPSGAKIEFGYAENMTDVLRYQGQSYTWIGIDELPQYPSPDIYNFLRSSLRSVDKDIPVYMREQEKEWRFPSGAKIEFGYAENMTDVLRYQGCLLYTSPSPRDGLLSRMPSSA